MEIFLDMVKYGFLPLLTALVALGWHMHKKIETRVDTLENRTNDVEKAVLEIKTDFKYLSRDIKEIKQLIQKIVDK